MDYRVDIPATLHGCWSGLVYGGNDRAKPYKGTLWLDKDVGRSRYDLVQGPIEGTLFKTSDPFAVKEQFKTGGADGLVHLHPQPGGTLKVEWAAHQCLATMARAETD